MATCGVGKVAHYRDVEAKPFGEEAPGVSIRLLIDDERDGAPNYLLRMIEIEPGGRTPYHSHGYEHENFVIEGRGALVLEGERHELGPGFVAFVPADVEHRYECVGEEVFRFLCGIPAPRLREAQVRSGGKA